MSKDSKKSAWEKYKENLGSTRPWDMLDSSQKVSDIVSDERMSICLSCPELLKSTKQCKKCGCFMALKTKLKDAECPIGKWGKEINV